jgi:membrane protein
MNRAAPDVFSGRSDLADLRVSDDPKCTVVDKRKPGRVRHNPLETYNPAMTLTLIARKLFRTLARVIPQCGMVAQAVAFNMFLAFFAVLLIALSLMKRSLEGENGPQVAARLSAILPPGSWQLISAFVLREKVNTWYLALAGWVGTLLVGSQVIKLITKGIEMVYGGRHTHSIFGRQIRGLLLFSLASVAWLLAVLLSVFGGPWGQSMAGEFGDFSLVRAFWVVLLPLVAMILAMLVLALIYRVATPGTTTWASVLPGAAAATILWWAANILFGWYVRKTQYGPIYGGLTAAIGLMTWMEISAMLVFLGAAWNSDRGPRTLPAPAKTDAIKAPELSLVSPAEETR